MLREKNERQERIRSIIKIEKIKITNDNIDLTMDTMKGKVKLTEQKILQQDYQRAKII